MGELVSELAHELNQPLYAISNFAWACLNMARSPHTPVAPELIGWLEQICEQSQRAGEIIRRVYGFVRKAPTQSADGDLPELIRDCASLLQVSLRQQQIDLQLELENDIPSVMIDRVQIQQVIVNLMNNAIEAMAELPREQRHLTVKLFRRDDEEVEISVADQGCGSQQEDLERLFEPFFTTKAEGMGMGLAISRSIIDAHGGRLWAERNSKGGLTFRCSLPFRGDEV
jgi:two-component system sensor kinase FixL